MSKSEALRLADELEDDLADYGGQSLPRISQDIADNAAAELRRLRAKRDALLEALKAIEPILARMYGQQAADLPPMQIVRTAIAKAEGKQ